MQNFYLNLVLKQHLNIWDFCLWNNKPIRNKIVKIEMEKHNINFPQKTDKIIYKETMEECPCMLSDDEDTLFSLQ